MRLKVFSEKDMGGGSVQKIVKANCARIQLGAWGVEHEVRPARSCDLQHHSDLCTQEGWLGHSEAD